MVFYLTCTLGGTYGPLCFPQCYAVDTIRSIHNIFPRFLTFPLARVYQHTSVLSIEAILLCHGGRVEGNSPVLQQEESGSGEPTLADVYRLFEER